MALFWLSLAVAIVLPAIGIVVVVRKGLGLWRDLKRVGKASADALDRLAVSLERTSAATERLDTVSVRAEPSIARLEVSLARFAVLRSAADDVRDSLGRVSALYPRK